MEKQTKTWPLLVNETILDYQSKLICKTQRLLEDESQKNLKTEMVISGIHCFITREQGANMLLQVINKEQQELITINNKYNRLGLEKEAIIKSSFFRKIIRKVDLMKDLFFFSSCDNQSKVWANIETYNNSVVDININKLIDVILELENEEELTSINIEGSVANIINLAKDVLWERHSDSIVSTGKRRIKIELLDPPKRTKERLIDWKMEGFDPLLVCHRDSFMPSFLNSKIATVYSALNRKVNEFKKDCTDGKCFETIKTLLNMIKPYDPIVYIEDGDWTVVIDQYADFPQEQQIIFHVKDHYSHLGKQFGVISEN